MDFPCLQAHIGIVKILFRQKILKTFQRSHNRLFIQLLFKFIILGLIEGSGVNCIAAPDIQGNPGCVKSVFFNGFFQPPEIQCRLLFYFPFSCFFFFRKLIAALGVCGWNEKKKEQSGGGDGFQFYMCAQGCWSCHNSPVDNKISDFDLIPLGIVYTKRFLWSKIKWSLKCLFDRISVFGRMADRQTQNQIPSADHSSPRHNLHGPLKQVLRPAI